VAAKVLIMSRAFELGNDWADTKELPTKLENPSIFIVPSVAFRLVFWAASSVFRPATHEKLSVVYALPSLPN